jgi:hypothetical protein
VGATEQEQTGAAEPTVTPAPVLEAIVPADQVYRDGGTGKYIVAGTFRELNVERCPATFASTVGVFVSLAGVEGAVAVDVEFVEEHTGEVLVAARSLPIVAADSLAPVDFAVELPPLPLPRRGRYLFRVCVDGRVVGSTSVFVREQAQA